MPVTDTDYEATRVITDVFDSTTIFSNEQILNATTSLLDSGAIRQTGFTQKSLYDILSRYITNYNATMAKLDADGGVALTTYVANCGLSVIGSAGYKIEPNGFHQKDLVTCLTAIESKFDTLVAQLNGDAGVTDVNYASFDLDTTRISETGIYDQGKIVDFLNTAIAAYNTLLAKLDADA